MTLVLALRGTDGAVLAADTKGNENHSSYKHQGESLTTVTSGRHTTKILTSKKHGIMVAFAERDEARHAARQFIEQIDLIESPPLDLRSALDSACQETCKDYPYGGTPGRPLYLFGSLVAVNVKNENKPISRFEFHRKEDGKWWTDYLDTCDNQVAGLTTNSALFFLEQYYSFWKHPQPIERLIPIAGHIILSAARLTEDRIDGLEIAVCRKDSKPEFVQAETIRELYARSETISKGIANLLDKPLQKISLAETPDEIVRPSFVPDSDVFGL